MQAGCTPLTELAIGQKVRVVVMPHPQHFLVSMRPSAISAADKTTGSDFSESVRKTLVVGDRVAGTIDEAKDDHLYVSLPNDVRARVHCLHASDNPNVLACLPEKIAVGSVVYGHLLEVQTEEKHVSMSLLPSTFARLHKGGPVPKVCFALCHGSSDHHAFATLYPVAEVTVHCVSQSGLHNRWTQARSTCSNNLIPMLPNPVLVMMCMLIRPSTCSIGPVSQSQKDTYKVSNMAATGWLLPIS